VRACPSAAVGRLTAGWNANERRSVGASLSRVHTPVTKGGAGWERVGSRGGNERRDGRSHGAALASFSERPRYKNRERGRAPATRREPRTALSARARQRETLDSSSAGAERPASGGTTHPQPATDSPRLRFARRTFLIFHDC
jgi:hypothetical protein